MRGRVLITGGAGFIGSHLADELLSHGYDVRVLDNLSPQVHGGISAPPDYLARDAEFMYGDVRDKDAVKKAIAGMDAVFHFAAMVGVGQSMYSVENYTSVNNYGTAVLLQTSISSPVKKLIVASSMSIYGEGLYKNGNGVYQNTGRSLESLRAGIWDICDKEGTVLEPVPTPESKTAFLSSIYALSKYDQERMCLMIGNAYSIPTVALRFFNVFGTRQSLSNPYTGVLAIFASRLLNNKPPLIYEDGCQKRDFVSVHDIVKACRLALEREGADNEVVNVGSGHPFCISEVAEKLSAVLGKEHIKPVITGKYRMGDIRHCYADIGFARKQLGYEPDVIFEKGLEKMADWLSGSVAVDGLESAHEELDQWGLTI